MTLDTPLTRSIVGNPGDLIARRPAANFNMARYCISAAAEATPGKTALIVIEDLNADAAGEVWTFSDIEQAVLRIASGLADAGLKSGDRVLIRLENTTTYALLFFGAIAGGFVPLPTSSQLTAREASFIASDSGAQAVALADGMEVGGLSDDVIVFGPQQIETMIASGREGTYADTLADDPAFLIYTSGTTANPKGVLHAQRSAWGRRPMYAGWYGIGSSDRVLHAGAFNWTYTLGTGLTDPWANGATSIIFTGAKSPEVWPRLIEKTKATLFAAVPGLFRQILKYGDLEGADVASLRHGLIAGEKPPAELSENWYAATGTQLYEALGMSEISTYVSSSPSVPPKPDTVGKPQAGRCVAILPEDGGNEPVPIGEAGLIAVHRYEPGLMLGYWNREDEESDVTRGDWFFGGDLGVMDEDGYITHLGRANDVMKALGYRVAPQEVEAALAGHRDISEVACAELQVRADVRVIAAYIVLRDGAHSGREMATIADDIKSYAAERLADYKRPREIIFVEALPRTPNGKVKRSDLSALWGKAHADA